MTLFKLSVRNAKRQAKDYVIYFVTITVSVAFMFAFYTLAVSKEIQGLSLMLDDLYIAVGLASLVVVGIVDWLVVFTLRFILIKRSKELGIYILLGFEKQQVAHMFFIENLIIGSIALVMGIILGNFLFEFMRAMLQWMLRLPYEISFSLSIEAVAMTFLCMGIIYLSTLTGNRRRLGRIKIYELIYLDKQNESGTVGQTKSRTWMFVGSIVCGVLGTILLVSEKLLLGTAGAGLLIIFMYGFFISFSSGVPNFFDKRPQRKYYKTRLLVYRALSSKLNVMGVTMASVAVLLTATMLSGGAGLYYSTLVQRSKELDMSYDLLFSGDLSTNFKPILDYVAQNIQVKDQYQYQVYYSRGDQVYGYIKSVPELYIGDFAGKAGDYADDQLMRLSDYNALRKMLGWKEVELAQGHFMIHSIDYLKKALVSYNETLLIGSERLKPQGVYTEPFSQLSSINGWHFIIIVPDEVMKPSVTRYMGHESMYAMMTYEPISREVLDGLGDMINEDDSHMPSMKSASDVSAENAAILVMAAFPLFYLTVIFLMAAATVLTIQILSDADRYKRQYGLLKKLGMDQRDMRRMLSKQCAIFFAMPVLPSLLIGVTFMHSILQLEELGILRSQAHLWGIIGLMVLLFIFVYIIYVVVSYMSLKKNVWWDMNSTDIKS